jgi:spore maturation protein CgeB
VTRLAEDSRLATFLREPRFRRAAPTAVLLEPTYYLAAECRRAAADLGHALVGLPIPAAGGPAWIRAVLEALLRHRPDFVLAINHLGFDADGALARVLDDLDVPTAVWYVDRPEPILGERTALATAHTSVFCWERACLPFFRRLGFAHVEHLPLAAGLTAPDGSRPIARPCAFVGDSLAATRTKWERRLAPAQRDAAERFSAALAADPGTPPPPGIAAGPDALGFAFANATMLYRQSVLQRLPQLELTVFGDAGWQALLPHATSLPPVDYYRDTAGVYASTAVNLNVTSRQMPTAVNQRVFDVPACGGFLLTDRQADLEGVFPEPGETATFASPDEAAERYAWFAKAETERRRVIEAARARVQACHGYAHRLARIAAAMRARYG